MSAVGSSASSSASIALLTPLIASFASALERATRIAAWVSRGTIRTVLSAAEHRVLEIALLALATTHLGADASERAKAGQKASDSSHHPTRDRLRTLHSQQP